MKINANDYLKDTSYNSLVQQEGLERVVKNWEFGVNNIIFWENISFDDYLLYLGSRRVIQDVLENCSIDEVLLSRIKICDNKYIENTIEIKKSVFISEQNNEKNEHNWFSFYIPQKKYKQWEIYLK